MHRVLKRQLRRALQLPSNEAVDAFVEQLRATAPDPANSHLARLQAGFAALIDAVGDNYAQLERDLDLRTRSLDISSGELFELNARLRGENDSQQRAQEALLAAAKDVANTAGLPTPDVSNAGLQQLAELLTSIVQERQRAVDAQLRSEQRLRLALDASNFSLWDWDFGSHEMYFEKRFARLIGRPEQDALYSLHELATCTAPEDARRLAQAIADVARARIPHFAVELRFQHASGETIWLQTFGAVTQRDAKGHAVRLTGTVADVTARKRLEESVANNLTLLESILEAMPLPVLLRDTTGRVVRVNAAAEHAFAVPRAKQLGRTLGEFLPQVNTTSWIVESDRLVVERAKPLRYETSIERPDGLKFDAIIAKAPVMQADGTVTAIASVITDITEQKHVAAELDRARIAAESAVEAKSRFLANMSHELRTPLNGVVGMASLLETTPLDPRQQRYVQTLRTSAEALITIINDILDISKIEAGKLALERRAFDPRRELEHVVSLFSARAFEKGLDIATHVGPDVPASMEGDAARLRQVLGNLVSNAVKFTERGCVLVSLRRVRTEAGASALRIAVEDTGIGLTPEQQARVFEAFTQADDSVTRRFGGTGLGLTICRDLVALMEGELSVASEPGHGSRFYFDLPCTASAVASDPPSPEPSSLALVVSPFDPIRTALAEAAAHRHGSVWECRSLREVLPSLESRLQDVGTIEAIVDADPESPDIVAELSLLRLAAGSRRLRIALLVSPARATSEHAGVDRIVHKPIATHALFGVDAPLPVPQAPTAAATGQGAFVLLVEDNAVNREVATAMLETLGHRAIVAENGVHALDLFMRHPDIDLVLMDCQMPEMDGFTATRAIRAMPSGASVPIVAMTGNAMEGDREACLAAGMNDYLTKPTSLEALRSKLAVWLPRAARAYFAA